MMVTNSVHGSVGIYKNAIIKHPTRNVNNKQKYIRKVSIMIANNASCNNVNDYFRWGQQ
jgi:hypothetical protein